MDDIYRWVLDTRETNPVFLAMVKVENWITKPLKLSDFIPLPSTQPDMDVADFTNENADGLVELKTFADLIGSTTGANVHHLEEQVIKMKATGLPMAVIVYGSREAYQLESGVSDEVVLSGLQKLTSLASIFHVTVIQNLNNEHEAIEAAKTFIRHCNQLPYALPALHLLKRGGCRAVGFYVGIDLIGEKTAKIISAAWDTPADLGEWIKGGLKNTSIERVATILQKKTPGIRIDQARSVIMTYMENNKNQIELITQNNESTEVEG